MLQDFSSGTAESDLTHLPEILEKHDLSMDLAAGPGKSFIGVLSIISQTAACITMFLTSRIAASYSPRLDFRFGDRYGNFSSHSHSGALDEELDERSFALYFSPVLPVRRH